MQDCDIAIIGAGMAGASIAAEIGPHASAVVLEAEEAPGYHSTGRSAAFWEECYGGPGILPLTKASGRFLHEHDFLRPRGALYLARAADEAALGQFVQRYAGTGAQFERVGRAELERLVPGIRPHWDRAIRQPQCADIDVAGLHAHYLAQARAAGVAVFCRARVERILRESGNGAGRRWLIETAGGHAFRATTLVNAAGAWADRIAAMAGAQVLGIQPYRRTVAQLRIDPLAPASLPLCIDISGGFYFKPESGRLWLSPHDETPCDPVDAAPEELDVAIAIDRMEQVVEWRIEAVERKWAGLRSFAPDRLPVYGPDPQLPDFFWFAGQGGFGIQTAPAAARLAAQLLLDRPCDAMTAEIASEAYFPARFS